MIEVREELLLFHAAEESMDQRYARGGDPWMQSLARDGSQARMPGRVSEGL
jgi:hypothetical protein